MARAGRSGGGGRIEGLERAPWCRWRHLARPPRDPYLASKAGANIRLKLCLGFVAVAFCVSLLWAGLSLGGMDPGASAGIALLLGWLICSALTIGLSRWLIAGEVLLGPGGSLALTPFPKRYVARDRCRLVARAALFSATAFPLYLIASRAAGEEPSAVGQVFFSLQRAWMPIRGWSHGPGDGVVLLVALFGLAIDLSWYPLAAAWGSLLGVRAAHRPEARSAAFWRGAACFGGVLAMEWLLVRLLIWLADDGGYCGWMTWRHSFWNSDLGPLAVLVLFGFTLAAPFWARLALARILREHAARELDGAELGE